MKAIRCKKIYTSLSPTLLDGYLLIDGNRIQSIIPAESWNPPIGCKVLDYEEVFLMAGFHDGILWYSANGKKQKKAAAILYEKNRDKFPDQ